MAERISLLDDDLNWFPVRDEFTEIMLRYPGLDEESQHAAADIFGDHSIADALLLVVEIALSLFQSHRLVVLQNVFSPLILLYLLLAERELGHKGRIEILLDHRQMISWRGKIARQGA